MKKLLLLTLIAFAAGAVQAEDTGSWTKEKFVKKNKEWAKNPKSGWNFNQAKTEARFDELDTDGDGMLSYEERQAGKKESASKAPVAKVGADDDWTKEQFVKKNKEWSKHPQKGWNFNQAKSEARFDELDTNGDGLLSPEEREAGKKK